uniref:Uncharacterized protein n=1 Tax=Compsopogon caeruleus TaxID=31354 RepID=A0A7S1TFE6_9RHOD|mmetsp:Transcript_3573/g.6775  ORF Transcript_3573/g.6775 Transcript_3573/m.6775 type:complete len:438 (+) Transcript_3573:27-1340(+)
MSSSSRVLVALAFHYWFFTSSIHATVGSEPVSLWNSSQELTGPLPSGDAISSGFGSKVAIWGRVAIIGAPALSRGSTLESAGAAYVFLRRATREPMGTGKWTSVATLVAPDAASYDFFGDQVAVSRDTAVVSATYKTGAGVGGALDQAGSVYVFSRTAEKAQLRNGGGNWTLNAVLDEPNPRSGNWFGISVGVAGDTIVVGARQAGNGAGAAYIFRRNPLNNWSLDATLLPPNYPADKVQFGWDVAVSRRGTAVLSAVSSNGSGTVFIFTYSNETNPPEWSMISRLLSPSPSSSGQSDYFGSSVSISGRHVVIGAPTNNTAYIFSRRRSSGTRRQWTLTATLVAEDSVDGDFFGGSVSVVARYAVVGAQFHKSFGAAYLFQLESSRPRWTLVAKLVQPEPAERYGFGSSVHLSRHAVLVGSETTVFSFPLNVSTMVQ